LIPHSTAGNDGHGQLSSPKTPILHAACYRTVSALRQLQPAAPFLRDFDACFSLALGSGIKVTSIPAWYRCIDTQSKVPGLSTGWKSPDISAKFVLTMF
jgi:hypothetical protein